VAADRARIRLSVPGRAEEIATVRSFAAAVGRHGGFGPETTEDLKLALSEIAAGGIESGGTAIHVSVREHPGSLQIDVQVPGAADAPMDPILDRTQLLHALFPALVVDRRPSVLATSFSVDRG
jgi:anti-sigma regulatory factor (Ser/Thr protein kinase)